MPARTGTAHVVTTRRVYKDKVYCTHLLRRSYRDVLRSFAPNLRFVHLTLSPEQAAIRVSQRSGHYFHPQLISSQFAALELPLGEPGVLTLDAALARDALLAATTAWLESPLT